MRRYRRYAPPPERKSNMVMNVNATAVGTSAATETGISAEMGAATAAASAALVGVLPMGADLDSAEFAAAQDLAAATYTATDLINNAALGLA
jgi:hypothetical protein